MAQVMGNVIVGQSGGPTAVINSSLAGGYKTARDRGARKVFGMLHGIQGLLEERVADLSKHIRSDLDIDLLKRTPSSFLGSCRYKLPEIKDNQEIYDKIFAILDKLEIEYFFYIGGNDSMDTIKKLSDYAILNGSRIRFMGVPKTIDNDLAVTDHTPGFGSAAKYIASIKEVIRDGLVYDQQNVTLLEIMGRNAGWLTGAAALAKGEDCEGPDMMFLPELIFDVEKFMNQVAEIHKVKKSVVIAISEGVKVADGRYVCELTDNIDFVDAFGHRQLTGTARYLAEKISKEVPGCKTRAIEFNSLQRCASHIVGRVDITEAYQVGGAAVKAAFEGETGKMIILKRVSDDPYLCVTDIYDVHKIANVEKKVPREWINEEGNYVTQAFINYVRPLIQAELTPMMVDGLPRHLRLDDISYGG